MVNLNVKHLWVTGNLSKNSGSYVILLMGSRDFENLSLTSMAPLTDVHQNHQKYGRSFDGGS